MDREMIAARRSAIGLERLDLLNKLNELDAELNDLAAAERVLDRHEGKQVASTDLIEGITRRNRAKEAIANAILFPESAKTIASATKGGHVSADTASGLRKYILERQSPASLLKRVFEVHLPDKKLTLPEMITEAMAMLTACGETPSTPKKVEEMVQTLFNPGQLSQNVNSVMWRMVQQGTLVKDPDAPLYSLPNINKAADEVTLEGPSAALESNPEKQRDAETGGGT